MVSSDNRPRQVIVDTNVLLRYLTGEPEQLARSAQELMAMVASESVLLVVPHLVLAEVVWTLHRGFRLPRAQVADALLKLIEQPGVEVENEEQVVDAMRLFRSGTLSYVDCHLLTVSVTQGLPVATQDRKLQKALADRALSW